MEEKLMFKEVIDAIANLGFPVVISLYLLIRIENQIQLLTKSIDKLTEKL